MKSRLCKWLYFFLLMVAVPVIAQEACPASVIRSFARAGAACTDIERNHACYGNGSVIGVFDDRNTDSFALVGERAGTNLMQQLLVGGVVNNELSVALMQLQSTIINTEPGRNVAVVAFGDVTMTNEVPVRPTVRVESTGVLYVRDLPNQEDGDILEQFPLRTTVVANGITAEGDWLRIEIPDTSDIGWISVEHLLPQSDLSSLNVVDVNTPFLRPFQVFSFVSGHDDALCEGTPESGLLLQSPNIEDEIQLTINGVDVRLAGTAFLQTIAGEGMVIRQIDGRTVLQANTDTRYVVAGSQISVPLDAALTITGETTQAMPYDALKMAGLPVNNLNYRVRIPEPLEQAAIEAQIARLTAEPTPRPSSDTVAYEPCIRTTNTRVNLYAGPGTFHEVIRELTTHTRVYPALRLTDSSGVSWWQLNNGHWLLESLTDTTGNCDPIPVTEIVAPPTYNHLRLETCDTTNGPIRNGQYVTIEFVDGGWETIGEATEAPRIDPGRISVNQERLYVHAGAPQQVQPERYYRSFTTQWYAQAGTFRIVGNRLHYTVICDITVPLG